MGRLDSCAEILAAHQRAGRHLCVGLDTDFEHLPASVLPFGSVDERVVAFNREIVDRTAEIACAFKPNAAFYEALGECGFRALAGTIAAIKERAPDVPVILDAKRADIGSTNRGYAAAAFDRLGADALTVHPYLGGEALSPFLERAEKLLFVLARTSNPGAGEFQDLLVDGLPLYRRVARSVALDWNRAGNCGLVVGATYADELAAVRAEIPVSVPILVPGIGAQGGDLAAVVEAHTRVGSSAFLLNASRSILFASDGADFADAAGAEAQRLHLAIRAQLDATQAP
ncbi:MAG: orotidine-5'-phosphate decarboxylase [Solirubrobacterales bacterium]